MTERLRLKAVDEDDLKVIAACLQDALIPLREMAYMAEDRRFMAAFSRFQWERLGRGASGGKLMLCQAALRIDNVERVQYRGLDGELGGLKFELLTVLIEPAGDQGFDISLLFAGDVAIRLGVSELSLTLEDFGDPWEANVTPIHDLPDAPPREG